ncbi:hypothetical protein AB0N06_09060 [Streptomyces sp. NPDC051020]|uniref:hypothetical protein n=1 Tax=Streptomyces sp. NPDC051020 TaxID=3155409 RepID=UPI0034425C32
MRVLDGSPNALHAYREEFGDDMSVARFTATVGEHVAIHNVEPPLRPQVRALFA